jgi:hypothetical protein
MQLFDLFEAVTGARAVVYHRTKKRDNVAHISSAGFTAGEGALYGRGIYTTYDLHSQFSDYMKRYGTFIIKSAVDLRGFLILDAEPCRAVYGKLLTPLEQAKKFAWSGKWKQRAMAVNNGWLDGRVFDPAVFEYSSKAAKHIHDVEMITGMRGIVYTGKNDGRCVVVYDADSIIPLSYTHTPIADWASMADLPADELPWTRVLSRERVKQSTVATADMRFTTNPRDFDPTGLSERQILSFIKQAKYKAQEYDDPNDLDAATVEQWERVAHRLRATRSTPIQVALVAKSPTAVTAFLLPSVEAIRLAIKEDSGLAATQALIKLYRADSTPKATLDGLATELLAASPASFENLKEFDLPEAAIVAAVRAYPYNVTQTAQTPAVQMAALRDPYMIRYIQAPTEEAALYAVSVAGHFIASIANPSPAVQLAAVASEPNNMEVTVKCLTSEDAQLAAVRKWGASALRFIKDGAVTEALVNVAIDRDPKGTAQLCTDMPASMQHRVVARDPAAARYMRDYPSLDPAIAATLTSTQRQVS